MEVDTSNIKEAASPPSDETIQKTPTENSKNVTQVPSAKGHRPWKETKKRPAAAQRRTASLKLSLEIKNKRRQEREALMRVVRAAREADAAAKEAERKRREAKKKQKEENVKRGTQKLVITNPKKIAKMSKKQYLKYVHQKK